MVFEKLKFTSVKIEMKVEQGLLELAMPTLVTLPFSGMRFFATVKEGRRILHLSLEGPDASIDAALGTFTFLKASHSGFSFEVSSATGDV